MWLKRIGLFLLTNILVITTISVITNLLGVNRYIGAYGINYTSLLVFCFIWGMAGSIISLLLSKTMAKWMMGVQIINPARTDALGQDLLQRIAYLSQRAGLPMPEVGIYNSPELNAFATGPSKSSALVAVSTGLLQKLDSKELDGVLGHELTHVANGDMITMTLIQGVVNSFAFFLSRVISFALVGIMRDEDSAFLVRFVLTIVLDIAFSILGSIVVAYFSRMREFKADKGGAQLAGKDNMIAALKKLSLNLNLPEDNRGEAIASLKISHRGSGIMALFSTHPPITERIKALQNL